MKYIGFLLFYNKFKNNNARIKICTKPNILMLVLHINVLII